MNTFDPGIAEILDRACPARPGTRGDWGAVLRDANSSRLARRRRRLVAGALSLAAAAALGAFWPLGGNDGVGRAFAARALAALGDRPVLHVVVRLRSPGWVVDLRTDRRERPYAILEEWYRPRAGLREKVLRSNGGYVAGNVSVAPSPEGSYVDVLRGFATQYQSVLRDRHAGIAGHGTLLGRRVVWIRFRSGASRYSPAGTAPGAEYEVALDEGSYRPVYVRSRGSGGVRILSIDTRASIPQPVAAVPFPDESDFPMYGEGFDGPLREAEAATLMGKPAVWLGREHAGLPLAWVGGMSFAYGRAPTFAEIKHRWRGVNVVYGRLVDRATGFPDRSAPYVQLREQPEAEVSSIRGGSPQPGTLLSYSLRDGAGVVVIDGVRVDIDAPNEQVLLSVARSLQPIPAS